MKVLVIGANGQIGKHLLEKLKGNEQFDVTAGLRKESQRETYETEGYATVHIDLEEDINHMTRAMQGMDAVVFTAGSGGKTGADKTMLVDLDGAVKAIEAAKQADVDRFVMVSAHRADDREYWSYNYGENETAGYYFAAKYYADEWLKNSGLNYTIVRPTALLNQAGTGKIEAGETFIKNETRGEIAREDVAEALVAVLSGENTINKAFSITSGDTSIAEAIADL